MKKALLYFLMFAGGIYLLSVIMSFALSLLNESSSMAVTVGYAIIVANFALLIVIGRHLLSKANANTPTIVPVIIMAMMVGPMFIGCYTVVEPGYSGIKVALSGDHRGVDEIPVVNGRVWYNPFNEAVYAYPNFIQTAVWTHNENEGNPVNEEITFTTLDQMVVSADISIAYHIVEVKVPYFYTQFRNDDITKFTHGFMRNLAREKFDGVAGKYKIEQIMGDNLPFLTEVRSELQKALEPYGVIIDQFGFVGAPRPPQSVIDAINAKVGAIQKAIQVENELREESAKAKKRLVASQAEADANRILVNSITPQLMEWRRLDIQEKMISKWNGVRPQFEAGSSSNSPFIFNVPNNK